MSNRKKKRTKRYSGDDAKVQVPSTEPVVRRFEAVERNRVSQWWHERNRQVKVVGGIAAGLTIFSWLIYELVRLVF